jgi:CRISPR-associated protein Cmr6
MIKGLGEKAKQLGIAVEPTKTKTTKAQPIMDRIPRMYRAQVGGRCSLQFAGDNEDLDRWKEEWIYPKKEDSTPRYQYTEPSHLGLDGQIYCIKIEFPFRLLSNCGQDSIIRPVLGKNGIPLIPGSSIKGIFRRGCDSEQQEAKYCGDANLLSPGILRFHRAYPTGDWAGTRQVSVRRQGQVISETRYRIIDVIHPQQKRQVEGTGSPKALASISFYQPSCIFELSSSDRNIDWEEVEDILVRALQSGIGGKTSTGYGLGGHLPNRPPHIPTTALNIPLTGSGVSPLLRSDEPEFRPNVFKATLRGHTRRLLGGVSSDLRQIERLENQLFGSSESPGIVDIFWESEQESYNTRGMTPTYQTVGKLHVNLPSEYLDFLDQVLKFAFVMGGFGKSWRRVAHQKFYPDYQKLRERGLHIGCHWECSDSSWLKIKDLTTLVQFLNDTHTSARKVLNSHNNRDRATWKEAWHPDNVRVYALETISSQAVLLFHDDIFKYTPAIGGRGFKFDGKPDTRPTSVSSVWHRMFPIANGKYLEMSLSLINLTKIGSIKQKEICTVAS